MHGGGWWARSAWLGWCLVPPWLGKFPYKMSRSGFRRRVISVSFAVIGLENRVNAIVSGRASRGHVNMRGKGDVVGMWPTDRRHGFNRNRHASMPTTCGLMTGGSPRRRCTRFEPWKSHRVSRPPNRRRPVGLTRQAKSKRVLNGITVDIKDPIYGDRHMAGFGVRVHATGRKVYVVRSRRPASLAIDSRPMRRYHDRPEEMGGGRSYRPHQAESGPDAAEASNRVKCQNVEYRTDHDRNVTQF